MRSPLVFQENESQFNLYPFTLNRSVTDLRIGILSIREKWELLLGINLSLQTVDQIKEAQQNIHIPANFIPGLFSTTATEEEIKRSDHRILEQPWELTEFNDWALRNDFSLLTRGRISEPIPGHVKTTNPGQIFVEKGAILENCFIHAGEGPVYIAKNAVVMDGAMLRGPVSVGEGSVVKMGAAIYGATTIGPYCTVGGEIKNSIFLGYSNKAHHGYIGDSVIGEWCNLGAGTSCSNLKNTGGKIKVWDMHQQKFKAASNKCGLFMGDFSKSAINTSFNSGTITGICANIFDGAALTPKFIPSFSWGAQTGQSYTLEKALIEIETWMKFKNCILQGEKKQILEKIYKAL
jgi:UDP-N-acetylglucosamine diphosphorylase/glucosamine-1-phosphate N-acetyltransferase